MGFNQSGVNVFIHRYKAKSNINATLTKPLSYTCNDGRRIYVPEGFETNFASTPRIIWALFPPIGKWTQAAVLHDYLYAVGHKTDISRKEADNIFLEAMIDGCLVQKPTAYIMWFFVRVFGSYAYIKK